MVQSRDHSRTLHLGPFLLQDSLIVPALDSHLIRWRANGGEAEDGDERSRSGRRTRRFNKAPAWGGCHLAAAVDGIDCQSRARHGVTFPDR